MREIKFRAWDLENKIMIYFNDCFIEGGRGWLVFNSPSSWQLSNNLELLQYTGLNSINDKEIYEGDICKAQLNKEDLAFDIILGEVSFFLGEFVFTSGQVIYPLNQFSCHYQAERCLMEIIGNIYENPELNVK